MRIQRADSLLPQVNVRLGLSNDSETVLLNLRNDGKGTAYFDDKSVAVVAGVDFTEQLVDHLSVGKQTSWGIHSKWGPPIYCHLELYYRGAFGNRYITSILVIELEGEPLSLETWFNEDLSWRPPTRPTRLTFLVRRVKYHVHRLRHGWKARHETASGKTPK